MGTINSRINLDLEAEIAVTAAVAVSFWTLHKHSSMTFLLADQLVPTPFVPQLLQQFMNSSGSTESTAVDSVIVC